MYTLIDMQDVQSGIITAIRTLLLHLCEPVYKLIIFCFNIFEDFGTIRLFENSDTISGIYNRIGLILGLFMIFRISFSAIEYIINPDNILDKTKGIGNIVKKVIIVIVLLGSTRFLFDFAYDVQDELIKSKIVPNIILGGSTVKNQSDSGTSLAWYTFATFYKINDEIPDDSNVQMCKDMIDDGSSTNKVGAIYQNFVNDHSFDAAAYCLNLQSSNKYKIPGSSKAKEINVIKFNGLLCLVVGLFLLWTIFTFTIQLGVRVLQLAYLELIAPIPIMMYLTPNGDDKLLNWGKQCLTTFLDFFIRLAVMDFIVLVSNALIDLEDNIYGYFGNENISVWSGSYIIVIMIIALMIFAKRIPNLLQEILPSTGGAASLGLGFGMPGEARQVGGFLGGVAGGTVGAVAGGVVNAGISAIDRGVTAHRLGRRGWSTVGAAASGLGGGFQRGFRNGAHRGNPITNFRNGFNARHDADRNYEQLISSGGTARGAIASRISSHFGETRGQRLNRMINNLDRVDDIRNQMYAAADQASNVKAFKDTWEQMHQRDGENEVQYETRKRAAYQRYKQARDTFVDNALANQTFADANDNRQASEVRAILSDMNNYVSSHGVQLWDPTANNNEGGYVNQITYTDSSGAQQTINISEVTDRQQLDALATQSNNTRTHITREERYYESQANDRAAGVSETRSGSNNN